MKNRTAIRNFIKGSAVLLCLLLAIIVLRVSGCSTGNTYITPPLERSFEDERRQVLDTYYSRELIDALRSDAAPIIEHFGLNVFSTSQYGRRFITGTVSLHDVFDARIPENHEIFKNYARDNMLILNPPETGTYYRYALAAAYFVREFNYDAILLYPDEFNPVLTKKGDTWMFIREDPDGNPHGPPPNGGTYYVSGRIDNRQLAVTGGIGMEPINNNELWLFYKPVAGTEYQQFSVANGPVVSGSMHPELLNAYTPSPATPLEIQARQKLGIIPSPLSGRQNLRVGSWKPESYFQSIIDDGFSFSGATDKYTWSGCGHYVIPIDPEFWMQAE